MAIGEPSASWIARAKASMARVRGNFWLLVRAAILAFLPITAINVIVFLTVTRFYDRYPVSKYWFGSVALGQTVTGRQCDGRVQYRDRRGHGIMAL